ncbi:MAG TPA: AAA family ATPase [Dissulfurispiraceae bacterium]|nr:AAA family ATPase [Dissulfurispiraceae bacterium]
MYCEYYEFSEKPFTVTPNSRFIFLSKNHQEAFAHLLYGIDNHEGFIEFTGEIGTGKTTVLRTLLDQLDENIYRTALILNPCLSATELLRSINREYGITGEGLSNYELLQELNRFLLRERAAGRTVVLVIDEAQNLEPSVLEQIRLISNLETETDKLIQIVLAGQPELGRLLERSQLRQLAQRITVRYHLRPMDSDDTNKYIRHRLGMAGHGLTVRFMPSALKRIYGFSGGTPRLINIVCHRALLVGYAEGYRDITRRTVNVAIGEIRSFARLRPRSPWVWAGGICVAAVLSLLLTFVLRKDALRWPFHLGGAAHDTMASAGKGELTVSDDIKKGFADMGEKDSFLQSFNALAKIWNVVPIKIYSGKNPLVSVNQLAGKRDLRVFIEIYSGANPSMSANQLAGKRDSRVFFVKGNIKSLVATDLPALLEFKVPGIEGSRYRALTGVKDGRLMIDPPLSGRALVDTGELAACWTGRAFIFWKNYLDVPLLPVDGEKGPEISQLQHLLASAGCYKGILSGIYDKTTADAVRVFQKAKGLNPDGKLAGKTLLFLYREGSGFPVPRLMH